MLETFVLLIAGCSDDGAQCTALDRIWLQAETHAECERMLDMEMMATISEWPVLQGQCLTQDGMWAAEAAAPLAS